MNTGETGREIRQLGNDVYAIYVMLDGITSTQTELIATLARHWVILATHTRMLDEHTAKFDEHTRTLDEHTVKLDEHTVKLDEHTVKLDEILDILRHPA